jgi:type VI secretion system protein ImpJ
MTWTNRVVWQEGMFLRAQHFQQQDRWTEALLRARTAALRPHPWGIVEMAIDRDLLATGRFALASGTGVFEDGTPFAIPSDADHPRPLDLPDSTRNALVYLAAPVRQPGATEIADGDGTEGRYALRDFEVYDTHSASPQPAPLAIGRLRLRYLLENEERAGYLCIGLARVVEVFADRRATLDERWIAPSLVCSAAAPLAGLITEFAGLLNQRGEALAARMTAPGARGVAEVQDFLLLQSLNRWQKLLAHWADAANVHPEELYQALVQMAGEFATFTEASRRPSSYPAYRHDDLQRSFAPVVADLRRSLSAVIEQTAIAIPLQERQYGVRVGPITDRSILRAAMFVLTVQADRAVAPAISCAGQDRRRRAHSRSRQRLAAGHRGAAAAGGAEADPVLCGGNLFRAGPQQSALAADAELGRVCDPCVRGFPEFAPRVVGDPRVASRRGGGNDGEPVF